MSLNEFDIIQRYFSELTGRRSDTPVGIGDDCALLRPRTNHLIAVSTDTLVAGRHFFEDVSARSLGHKSLAVNLSDLAAMGAEPAWASLSLTMPQFSENWLNDFTSGFAELAGCYGVELIGGDLTRGALSITVTVHGQVSPEKAMTRSGARIGDLVCVSGDLGKAALALKKINQSTPVETNLLNALETPQPRVELGKQLAGFATSCIDISDGLVADLGHICKASACQARIELAKIPCDSAVIQEVSSTKSWDIPLSGGDDYELCFTLPASKLGDLSEISRASDIAISVIGEMSAGYGVICLDQQNQPVKHISSGYMHFS